MGIQHICEVIDDLIRVKVAIYGMGLGDEDDILSHLGAAHSLLVEAIMPSDDEEGA